MMMYALEEIARDQCPAVLPLHPRTRHAWGRLNLEPQHSRLVDPVGYLYMLQLEKHATVILIDSGGVQKEAFFSEVPCVTLRDETEWVETVEAGWNTIVGCDGHKMFQAISEVFRQKTSVCPYGTGEAAETILNILVTSK